MISQTTHTHYKEQTFTFNAKLLWKNKSFLIFVCWLTCVCVCVCVLACVRACARARVCVRERTFSGTLCTV